MGSPPPTTPAEIERTGDLHLSIPQAPLDATIAVKRVVRDAGVPPCFRPWGRTSGGGWGTAGSPCRRTHTHIDTTPGPPTSKAALQSLITSMGPCVSRVHCIPWAKDSLAGLRCIGRVVITWGICAALHRSAWASTVVYIGTTGTGCS